MQILEITKENIANQHIGCALGGNAEARRCEEAKKTWMLDNFPAGYRFHRLDARGKALIETTPAENAWAPIDAEGWLFIDCLWVSGAHKGKGVATALLDTAIANARAEGRKGLVALSSGKKRGFLSDPGFYRRKGFVQADTAPPDFVLFALPFSDETSLPKIKDIAKNPKINKPGIFIHYSHHCPHTAKYIALLADTAREAGVPFTAQQLTSCAQAQQAPCPFTTWSFYYNGQFITNEIFSPAKLTAFLQNITDY